jgi:hypothetical protein
MAVAHTILVTMYHMLKHGTVYQDLGGNYLDERDRNRSVEGLSCALSVWDTGWL